ncbi:hypothetical protein CLF_102726 [Clonorchis sinensis]|uniref:Uncharacterized protein n=1 Tax=Clonorchis sinensis TaxID=79923 RepID=G7Y8F3_CLOSI|nr:hypothetical protein CLF_102726 [Clonorchis sinensis]
MKKLRMRKLTVQPELPIDLGSALPNDRLKKLRVWGVGMTQVWRYIIDVAILKETGSAEQEDIGNLVPTFLLGRLPGENGFMINGLMSDPESCGINSTLTSQRLRLTLKIEVSSRYVSMLCSAEDGEKELHVKALRYMSKFTLRLLSITSSFFCRDLDRCSYFENSIVEQIIRFSKTSDTSNFVEHYSGCTLSTDLIVDRELGFHFAKISVTFDNLQKGAARNRSLQLETKLHAHKAVILSVLVCSIQSLTMYRCNLDR